MAMHNPAHPGELIRETIEGIREETGERLPLEEVAQGLGTTRKSLSAIISGKQGVSPEMAIKLAAGLGSALNSGCERKRITTCFKLGRK